MSLSIPPGNIRKLEVFRGCRKRQWWKENQRSEGRMKYVQCWEKNKFSFPIGKRYSMFMRTSVNIHPLQLCAHFMQDPWPVHDVHFFYILGIWTTQNIPSLSHFLNYFCAAPNPPLLPIIIKKNSQLQHCKCKFMNLS